MSKLEELIKELCPDGVEVYSFDDVCDYVRGVTYNKSMEAKSLDEPHINIFRANNITLKANTLNYEDIKSISAEVKVKDIQWLKKGDILMCAGSGSKEHIGKVAYIFEDMDYSFGGFMAVIKCKNIINSRYMFHILGSDLFNKHLEHAINSATINNINNQVMSSFSFPIPPLPVQEEIVRILDNFTSLQAELQAELQARKKQYEYYRDSLLTFGDDVPRVKIEDIATDIYRGSGIKRDEVTEEGISCVRYGEIYTSYNISFDTCVSHTNENVVTSPKYFEYGNVIFAITGESVEEISKSIVYLGNEKCMAGGDTVVLKHNQEPRYMAYVLSTTDAQKQKSRGKVKSKVVHSSVPSIKEIEIPLPSYNEQKRIADILDNFRILVDDISTGLPAEIETRQKQYEYYRNKLLTFKELRV